MRNPLRIIQNYFRSSPIIEASKYGLGEVGTTKSFWQKGIPPPANLADMERIYKEDGVVNAAVEQTVAVTIGPGFYTSIELAKGVKKASDHEVEAKKFIDSLCERIRLDEKNIIIFRDVLVYGNCFNERLPEFDFKILPADTMRVDRTPLGEIKGYYQIKKGLLRESVRFEPDQIIHFKFDVLSSSAYGRSMVASVYDTISKLNELDGDYLKIMERYGSPKILWKLPANTTDEQKRKFEDSLSTIPINRDPVIRGEVEHDILTIDPRGRFENLYEILQQKVQTGLKTPLLSYLRNATEASANVMLDYFKIRGQMYQRYHKRMIENEIFRPALDANGFKDVNTIRLNWGMEKTGVEEMKIADVPSLCDIRTGPVLSPAQGRELLRMIGIPVQEEALPAEPFNIPQEEPTPQFGDVIPFPERRKKRSEFKRAH